MASDLAKLIDSIAQKRLKAYLPVTAVVTSIRRDGVRVRFQGAASAADRSFKSLHPEELKHGDVVVVLPVGGNWVILGPALAQPRLAWYDDCLEVAPSNRYAASNCVQASIGDRVGVYRLQLPATLNAEAYFLDVPVRSRHNPAGYWGFVGPTLQTNVNASIGFENLPGFGQAFSHAKFWFDAGDATGYWMASMGNDSGQYTEANTGVKVSATVWRDFRVEVYYDAYPQCARFYIDGEQVAELSTYFPTLSADLRPVAHMRTTTAQAKDGYCDYYGLLADRLW